MRYLQLLLLFAVIVLSHKWFGSSFSLLPFSDESAIPASEEIAPDNLEPTLESVE